MTSWILSIDKDHPQHWGYAVTHRVWDLRTRRNTRRGDIVYFWQSGRTLVGRGLVRDDVHDSPSTGLPWDDGGTVPYNGRITFDWLDDYEGDHLTWADIQVALGGKPFASQAPHSDDSVIEARLAQLFGASSGRDDRDLPSSIDDAITQLGAPPAADLLVDHRDRTLAAIRLRQGQPAFRKLLLDAYGSRCAVTGSRTVEVLEAAHIMPYMGRHTNVAQNGLLLRSDVHTLFDRLLLTVVPGPSDGLMTRLHPDLAEGDYGDFDRAPLAHLPMSPALMPSPSYLRQHAEACDWL